MHGALFYFVFFHFSTLQLWKLITFYGNILVILQTSIVPLKGPAPLIRSFLMFST